MYDTKPPEETEHRIRSAEPMQRRQILRQLRGRQIAWHRDAKQIEQCNIRCRIRINLAALPAELAVHEISTLRQYGVERRAINCSRKKHVAIPVEGLSEFGINHGGSLRDAPNASKFPLAVQACGV